LILRNDPRLARHRITLYAAVTRQIRGSALAARRSPPDFPETVALSETYGSLAEVAAALAQTPPRSGYLALGAARTRVTADTVPRPRQQKDTGSGAETITCPLNRLWHLLDELDVFPLGAASRAACLHKNADTITVECAVAGGIDT